MGHRVEREFRRASDPLIAPGSSLLVAVSGGSDSVALLHLLTQSAPPRGLRLAVGHLDHGLRPDAPDDRAFVEGLAGELGLSCIADRRDVGQLRRRDESPAEAARRVRRGFLEQAREELGAGLIVTGHTLDDQAETVLMRLVRGAGSRALTGMAANGPGPWVRPLLGLEKAELREYLTHRGLAWREDPSNRDLRYDRNRCRELAVPALSRSLNPRAARHLVEAADRLREDALLLDELAERQLALLTRARRGGRIALDAPGLADQPPALARRLLRVALQQAGVDPRRVSARHVEALRRLAGAGRRRQLDLPARTRAYRTRDLVVLQRGRLSL